LLIELCILLISNSFQLQPYTVHYKWTN